VINAIKNVPLPGPHQPIYRVVLAFRVDGTGLARIV